MHKVSRSLLLAGVLAFGTLTAACGDKVEIIQPTGGVTGVTQITLTPPSATIAAGSTIQLAVSVVADAATAKTVTYTTSSSTVATVDNAGKVTGVAAGTATIIATSTVDATKAAASVITVTGGPAQNTPNTVAISSITQGGTLFPANLANVAGQLDVTLFVSGPGGTLSLIQNCTPGGATSTTGDVIVAQQVMAGSQNQSPVTLSYNTAATGTVTSGVAVVNNNVATPIALNGNCVLKAQLGTAVATNIAPFTLNNANFFRATTTFTKTTTLGTQNAISAANGLRYDQGDLKVDVTPVVFTTVTAGGAAQTPALASITYAGRTFANQAPTAGRFSVTFPSTGATAQNIFQYTSPAAGDQVTITGYTDTNGQQITIGNNVAIATLRSDNQSPTIAGPLAQALNLTGAPRNYINAAYAFSANNTAQTDAAFAASQNTVSYYVGAVPAGAVYPTAQSSNFATAACSIAGLTKVAAGADIAQTAAPFTPGYFVRVIENDPLGNVVCQDFGPFGVDKQNPNALAVTGGTNGSATNNSVITTGATNSFFSVDSVSGFTPNAELRTTVVRNFTTNAAGSCVVGAFANGTCGAVATGFNVDVTAGSATQGYYVVNTVAQDQAGNVSPTLTRVYLMDSTIPTVGGIAIPQTLAGGQAVTFTSQAADNVDLQASNFDITYSAASGGVSLFYTGDNYGPNYDATRVTSAPLNATVPFFIKQLQGTTAGGAPVAFAAGVGADSGKATTVTVRAIDAANLLSANSFAAIPAINIANSTGFSTAFSTFMTTNGAQALSNGNGAGTRSTTLTAQAVLNSATAQQANLPFTQVCFFYQQSAAGNAADPTIPVNDLVSLGCVASPDIADVANVSRTWTYRLSGFDPAAALGTAGAVNIFAVGVNANGVGIISPVNTNVTLQP